MSQAVMLAITVLQKVLQDEQVVYHRDILLFWANIEFITKSDQLHSGRNPHGAKQFFTTWGHSQTFKHVSPQAIGFLTVG